MSQKHAFVVYSGENEPGKVYHALVYAKQAHQRGDQSEVYFAGSGTVWPEMLSDQTHPMHPLFNELLNAAVVSGASRNCAVAFGRDKRLESILQLIEGPEESLGQIDLLEKSDSGYKIWTF